MESEIIRLIAEWEASQERGENRPLSDFFADAVELLPMASEIVSQLCPSTENNAAASSEFLRFKENSAARAPSDSSSPERANESVIAEVVEGKNKFATIGEYTLLGELGSGGMGIVHKARHHRLQRIVALKVLRNEHCPSIREQQRFQREAESAAKLDHPGIVPLFESGKHHGHMYLAMGYIDGTSLETITKPGPLLPRDAAEIIRQAAVAIQHAHERGVIHRDLKPANILVVKDVAEALRASRASGLSQLKSRTSPLKPDVFAIRITDFGIAKLREDAAALTASGDVIGTPQYMSPEQATGIQDVGTSTDIYGLGAVLYCLLTSKPPFQASTIAKTLHQVMYDDPVSIRSQNRDVSRDLESICFKCLEKNPERRYSNAAALAEDVANFLAGRPVTARKGSFYRSVRQWVVRHPRSLAACFVAILVLFVIARYNIALNDQRMNGILQNLLHCERRQVFKNIEELKSFGSRAREQSLERLSSPDLDRQERFRLELFAASVSHNDSIVKSLLNVVPIAEPEDILLISDACDHVPLHQLDDMWNQLRVESASDRSRLCLAGFLSSKEQRAQDWGSIPHDIVRMLVNVPESELSRWIPMFEKRKGMLKLELENVMRGSSRKESVKAAQIFADLLGDDFRLIAAHIVDDPIEHFHCYLPKLEKQKTRSIECLAEQLRKLRPQCDVGGDPEISRKRAQISLALLGLDRTADFKTLLGKEHDHTAKFQAACLFVKSGLANQTLLGLLERAVQGDEQYYLLLSLSQIDAGDIDPVFCQRARRQIQRIVTASEDSGVISAGKWVLSRPQFQENLRKANPLPAKVDSLTTVRRFSVGKDSYVMICLDGAKTFTIGSALAIPGKKNELTLDESELQVKIDPFEIGATEVTNRQFDSFLRDSHGPTRRLDDGTENCPVYDVTFSEAAEFCNWMSKKHGLVESEWIYKIDVVKKNKIATELPKRNKRPLGYRLPTEAEWEFACRSNTSSACYFGNDQTLSDLFAWTATNSSGRSHPVAQLMPNRFGLFDTLGNVSEWCAPTRKAPLGYGVLRGQTYHAIGKAICYTQGSRSPIEYFNKTTGFRLARSRN